MTDEHWQDPTQPWAPDETQTQWVRSGPTEGAHEWTAPAEDGGPQWADWDRSETTDYTAPGASSAGSSSSSSSSSEAAAGGGRSPAQRMVSLTSPGVLRLAAQVLCPLLLLAGLSFDDGGNNGWDAYTAWAIFAMVCALLQLAPVVGRRIGLADESSWSLDAVGTAGLVAYWVIIVLPGASSNTGFVQTLAVGFAVIGLWLSPGRRL